MPKCVLIMLHMITLTCRLVRKTNFMILVPTKLLLVHGKLRDLRTHSSTQQNKTKMDRNKTLQNLNILFLCPRVRINIHACTHIQNRGVDSFNWPHHAMQTCRRGCRPDHCTWWYMFLTKKESLIFVFFFLRGSGGQEWKIFLTRKFCLSGWNDRTLKPSLPMLLQLKYVNKKNGLSCTQCTSCLSSISHHKDIGSLDPFCTVF